MSGGPTPELVDHTGAMTNKVVNRTVALDALEQLILDGSRLRDAGA